MKSRNRSEELLDYKEKGKEIYPITTLIRLLVMYGL